MGIQTSNYRFPRLTLMSGLILVFSLLSSSCIPATPAPISTPVSGPAAILSTPTNVPAVANATALAPSISDLMFATHQDISDAHPTDFTFDAGPDAIYLSFNYANVPADANFQIQLLRGNSVVFKQDLPWTGASTGSLVQLISDDPRVLIPGRYVVNITLAQTPIKGFFNISETAGAPGARLLVDNFQNNLAGWGLLTDAEGSAEIGAGQLVLSTRTKRGAAYAAPPFELRDFDLSVDMQFVSGPPRAESTIDFRMNAGGGGYWFTIYANGFFEVDNVSGAFKPLIPLQQSAAIKPFGEANRLRVVAAGAKFAFYINDTLVGTATDNQSLHGGIGFHVRDFDESQLVTAAFSNLIVTLPKEGIVAQLTGAP